MSETILCQDTHLERLVIVKGLAQGVDNKRLLAEIAALQAIRSKHVVEIYDVLTDEDGNIYAIVEEFIDGDDLTHAPKPSSTEDFLKIVYPISSGIADIHAHGRIHRDVKRQNMKFDGEGCLKIFDFGLAKDDLVDASTVGAIGTPGYMAPELFCATASGETEFTSAVDVYAFAATALALVLGKPPQDMRKSPPVLPCAEADFSGLGLGLPAELAALMNSCLSPDPDHRPTMRTVADTFAAHLLRNQHRALIGINGRLYELSANNPTVDLSINGQGALRLTYDGIRFVVSNVSGTVAINNTPAAEGAILPEACVIVLGAPYPSPRTAITVDVSHPEVML